MATSSSTLSAVSAAPLQSRPSYIQGMEDDPEDIFDVVSVGLYSSTLFPVSMYSLWICVEWRSWDNIKYPATKNITIFSLEMIPLCWDHTPREWLWWW